MEVFFFSFFGKEDLYSYMSMLIEIKVIIKKNLYLRIRTSMNYIKISSIFIGSTLLSIEHWNGVVLFIPTMRLGQRKTLEILDYYLNTLLTCTKEF